MKLLKFHSESIFQEFSLKSTFQIIGTPKHENEYKNQTIQKPNKQLANQTISASKS